MQRLLILIFISVQFISHAQDTIYKRTGEILSTKILEINIEDVSYKRTDLMDGPLFILNKSDIQKIKYFNGTVDVFEQVKEEKPFVVMAEPLSYTSTKSYNEIQLTYRRGKYDYQGHTISERKVLFITEEKNYTLKNKALEYAILQSKKNKVLQYSFGFGGAGLSVVSLIGCGALSDQVVNSDQSIVAVGVLATAGMFITSQVLSYKFKLKRIKYVNEAADIYNENL